VLGAPPLEGFNWLAWILPFAVMIGGGVFLWVRSRQWIRPATVQPVESTARDSVEKDKYERKLEEELKRYG
jgi:cytochrome c-type biogenesis protein CcmH/NrfF